jgi:A/G-specific adenine glycosylase
MTTSGSSPADFRRALRRARASLQRDLPWAGHPDPWAVLVSEFMLQQTQVSRVREPWTRFLVVLPTPTACADAPLSRVLRLWEGLGYHRRAKALHDAARVIRDDFAGTVPSEVSQLRSLPGVGEYTANAVASFAYHRRVAVLDTNVGRVLARALANRPLSLPEARAVAQDLLPVKDSAAFNQSMIDLGARFCRSSPLCAVCPLSRACRWRLEGGLDPAPGSAAVSKRQPTFAGSTRQLRGRVLAELRTGPRTRTRLLQSLDGDVSRGAAVLEQLERDGLVQRRGRTLQLVGD